MSKDLNLLRPFNLELAKAGEPITTAKGNWCRFIGVLSSSKVVVEDNYNSYTFEQSNLRMAPICWIEDKPVYKGDILYIKDINQTDIVVGIHPNREEFLSFKETGACYKDNRNNLLSWTKPKQKKQGWINCYRENINSAYWYKTKEIADQMAGTTRIACVIFEYEVD